MEILEPWDLVNGGLVVFEIVGHAQWGISFMMKISFKKSKIKFDILEKLKVLSYL